MDNKTICMVSVTDKRGSTNIPQALAFIRAGFSIIPVNYRTIITTYGMDYFEKLLIHTVSKYRPFLTIFTKCNGINSNIVSECNKYSKTFLWNPDPIDTIKRCPEVLEHAKNATFSSCTSRTTADWFEEQGVEKCYDILEGLDHDIFHPVEPDEKYKADISFIGTKTPERDSYKDFLETNGFDVKFYGPDYSGTSVVDKEFAKVCSSSKFMLSLNTYNNIPYYFSDRILLYTGCGACTLHLDSTNTLNEWFQHGKEIIYFANQSDLLHKLHSLTDDDIMRISIRGRERTLNNYTWNHTITKILDIVNGR